MQRQLIKNINLKYASLAELEKFLSAKIIPLVDFYHLYDNTIFVNEDYKYLQLDSKKRRRRFRRINQLLTALDNERCGGLLNNENNSEIFISTSETISIFDSHHPQFCPDVVFNILSLVSFKEVTGWRRVSKVFNQLIDRLPINENFIIITGIP